MFTRLLSAVILHGDLQNMGGSRIIDVLFGAAARFRCCNSCSQLRVLAIRLQGMLIVRLTGLAREADSSPRSE